MTYTTSYLLKALPRLGRFAGDGPSRWNASCLEIKQTINCLQQNFVKMIKHKQQTEYLEIWLIRAGLDFCLGKTCFFLLTGLNLVLTRQYWAKPGKTHLTCLRVHVHVWGWLKLANPELKVHSNCNLLHFRLKKPKINIHINALNEPRIIYNIWIQLPIFNWLCDLNSTP